MDTPAINHAKYMHDVEAMSICSLTISGSVLSSIGGLLLVIYTFVYGQ